MDVMKKANELLAQGKRSMVVGEVPKAVNVFEEAVKLLVQQHGEMSHDVAEAYFQCGSALLELCRMETSVLGGALDGVEVEEEKEVKDSEQFEKAPADDDEERDKLREQVYDAMSVDQREKDGEKPKEDREKTDENGEKTDENGEKTDENGEKTDENGEKTDETTKGSNGKDDKEVDMETEKNATPENKTEKAVADGDATNKIETTEKETMEADSTDTSKNTNKIEGNDETEKIAQKNSSDVKSKATDAVEDKMDNCDTTDQSDSKPNVDSKKPEAKPKELKDKSDAKEKTEKEMDTDINAKTDSEMNGDVKDKDSELKDGDKSADVEADSDGDTAEDGDTADDDAADEEKPEDEVEDEVGHFQLAWEYLDLAKVIYSKKEGKDDQLKAADCLIKLGEHSMETENAETAVADLESALKIQKEHLEKDDRILAETYYQLGLACTLARDMDKAILQFEAAIAVLESRIESLKKIVEEKEVNAENKENSETDELKKYKDEIKDIQDLIPEMRNKIEDTRVEQKDMDKMKEAAREMLGLAGTTKGFGFPTKTADASSANGPSGVDENGEKKASDISSLMRKKRKQDEEPTSTIQELKKIRQENGSGDAQVNGVNGESNEAAAALTNGHVNGHVSPDKKKSETETAPVAEPMAT